MKAVKFDNFKLQLHNAVVWAEKYPNPTKDQVLMVKESLKKGLTNGQYDLVKRVYNSTIRSIEFNSKKN